tara:strand:+ start:593 stop:928 length:336 start_codon:yes stop_codon:yes gene_type:complete
MEITGTVVEFSDQSGVTKAGKEFKKSQLVIKNNEGYNDAEKFIAFTVLGKSIENFNHAVGDLITVFFDIESREYNGKYYTEAKAWQFRRTAPDSFTAEKSDNPKTITHSPF